jgi:hypothetical protein
MMTAIQITYPDSAADNAMQIPPMRCAMQMPRMALVAGVAKHVPANTRRQSRRDNH